MRAPVLVFPQTKPSKQGLSYLENTAATPAAFGADIAKGLGAVGDSLIDMAAQTQKRNEKTERFGALISFSDFQTDMTEQLAELKRSAPADVTDFPTRVNDIYTKGEQAYISTLSPRLQQEFTFRARQIKQGVMTDALSFQFTQQDAHATAGIAKEYERSKNVVFNTPDEIDKEFAKLETLLDASVLPPAEQDRLAREMHSGLIAVKYGKDLENGIRASPAGSGIRGSPAGVQSVYSGLVARGLPQMQAAVMAGNVEQESSGNPNSEYDKEGTLGIMQWRLERRKALERFAARTGREARDIDAQMDYMLQEAENEDIAPGQKAGWRQFINATTPEDANEGLKRFIAYGDNSKGTRLANAKRIMGADPEVIERINNDPEFVDIPLEDRQAIQAGAQRKVNEEIAAATNAANDAAEAARNTLYNSLADGQSDEADIQAASKPGGLLWDIDDREKAEKILSDRTKGVDAQEFMASVIANNGAGYGTGDNDTWNKAFEASGGRESIAARDQNYFNSSVLPAVQAVQDVPTDLIGQLATMARSNDSQSLLWAYNNLALMEDKAAAAYAARVPKELSDKVDQFRYAQGYMPEEELINYLRGGRSPEDQRISAQADAQANAILANPEMKAGKYAADPTRYVDTWRTIQPGTATFTDKVQLSNEFKAAFKFNYRITGDHDAALKLTDKQLQKIWGTNTWGGTGTKMMRLPPDKAGYKGDHRSFLEQGYLGTGNPWERHEQDIRDSYGLTSEEDFFLRSDNVTGQEFEAFQAGKTKDLPSYRVFKVIDGREIEVSTPTTRWWGVN